MKFEGTSVKPQKFVPERVPFYTLASRDTLTEMVTYQFLTKPHQVFNLNHNVIENSERIQAEYLWCDMPFIKFSEIPTVVFK